MFIPQDHTLVLSEAFDTDMQALEQREIPQRSLVAVTTDNGTYVNICVSNFGFGSVSHAWEHNVHLTVTNSVKNDRVVGQFSWCCKKLVSCFLPQLE